MLPVNFHHLYYFKIIAEEGGVTAASKRLRLAPSTLSAQLGQLEESLDSPLFERRGRRLVLTERGREILDYAGEIAALGQELADTASDRPAKGTMGVQVGYAHGVPRALADRINRSLFEGMAGLAMQVRSGTVDDLAQALESHRLDFGVSDRPPSKTDWPQVDAEILAEIPVVLGMTAALGKRLKRLPRDLQDFPVVLPAPGSAVHQGFLNFLSKSGVRARVIAEVEDIELARRMALAGLGAAPINRLSFEAAPSGRRLLLKRLPESVHLVQPAYLLTRRRLRPHPAVALARMAGDGLR